MRILSERALVAPLLMVLALTAGGCGRAEEQPTGTSDSPTSETERDQGARQALAALGLEPLRIGTQAVQLFHIKTANLILCMTQEQQERLEKKYVSAIGKTRTLMSIIQSDRDIFEPRSQDAANHGNCLAMMRPALDSLADRLG